MDQIYPGCIYNRPMVVIYPVKSKITGYWQSIFHIANEPQYLEEYSLQILKHPAAQKKTAEPRKICEAINHSVN